MSHAAYDKFTYLYPPRTEMKQDSGKGELRTIWETLGDVQAQFKLNGTRNCIYVFPDGSIECWNRHREQQKRYDLTPIQRRNVELMGLPEGKFHVLDGELVHSKTKNVKDVLYMFDILVYNSEYLLGDTYGQRYDLLHRLMGGDRAKMLPLDFNMPVGSMVLAPNFSSNRWDWMYEQALAIDFVEGMVLKRFGPVSRLVRGLTVVNNAGFMCRIRKPHKNYVC